MIMVCIMALPWLYPIHTIESRTGITIQRNKRNSQKQVVHLTRARAVQDFDCPNGEWRGRPSLKQVVRQCQREHPEGRKTDCIRETGLSKKTVYKWWKDEEKDNVEE